MTINFSTEDSTSVQNKLMTYLENKVKYLSSKGSEGEKLFGKEMINQIPKVLFLLLPVFALIFKLLFIRHKIYYLEHMVFSLHFHTFIFLFLNLAVLFPYWYIIYPTLLGAIFYLFTAIRNFYQQIFWKTVVKINILMILYMMCLIPAFIGLVFLAVISV